MQHLEPTTDGHLVRSFTQSTPLRPIAGVLTNVKYSAFLAAYDAAFTTAYPPQPDGSVLFPFRRVFFVLKV
jgi:trans-aconitate 2-methyltransferase